MKKTFAAFGLIAGLMTATASHADVVGMAGEIGTTGIGFHASIPLQPNLNARLGLGYLGYSYSGSTSDMEYKLKLKANTYDALLDWYPSADSTFRLTTGLAYNGNKIDVDAQPSAAGSYTVNGRSYSAGSVGQVTGKVSFNKVAPYLGIGWGRPSSREKGWSFSTDIGVLLQGSPRTTLSNNGCAAGAPVCAQFANDLARENDELRDEVKRFKAYPVLRIGVSYKF
ncbi:hypothetical protein RY831_15800 [Noviherbaspirillum sp. CPCC 100848]|uniref:Histidine kinase n=2 Tax=Noviherbaspirillum album TaxID=3080276 RepID=A0ABU6JAS0_9BURK|nr:hypothetical protein [Noviherbaspirillum sp. CPCC 100848]